MKKAVASVLAVVVVAFLFLPITSAQSQPSVGVKKGDWMEYTVKTTGVVPAAQDITWAKIEILSVQGEAFTANFTVKYVNGTVSSNVGSFNFTSGNTEAWVIIPANLGTGQSFYDSPTGNVTIQGQLQKTVAGATRAVTYTNLTLNGVVRDKQWDKATGFYIQSADDITTAAPVTVNDGLAYTVNAQAYATNIWSPQILGLNRNIFYLVLATVIIVVVAAALIVLVALRAKKKR